MQSYFGPQGLLAKKIEHFEYRASQMEMAQAVFECLKTEIPLLVEAGTGTGKTWAYLIPAILSGKKVIVSTGTKTLQDQILDFDIPLLKRLLFPRLHAVCLKGRKNYLCRRRFRDFNYQPTFWSRAEAKLMGKFQNWAARTQTGDRNEIGWLPDQFRTWEEVSSNSEQCLGQQCEEHSRCFLLRARMEAARSDIVVVNHHLFFADLAIRNSSAGEIIPEYDAVIFDEAHQLEDVIGVYFGMQFSNLQLVELARDIQRDLRKNIKKHKAVQQIQGAAQQLEVLSRLLHQHLFQLRQSHGRFPLDLEGSGSELARTCRHLIHALEQISATLTPASDSPPENETFFRRSLELAQAVRTIVEQKDGNLVYWYELTPQYAHMRATPVDVASILAERLLPRTSAVTLTSATLSIAGSFEFVRSSLGFPAESRERLLPSPFCYEEQAVMYIPSRFPSPQDSGFCGHVAQEALKILTKTKGRALFLFTSYRNMNEVFQFLKDRLPYPILVQGQRTKRALLAEFKEKIDSVLLATSSFWQGIDVPGEALSCLLIDKLPFEVPDDPVIAARMKHLEDNGKSSFFNYQVPRAIIQLKQGIGRLIRSSRDRGIVAIFDVRLFSKSYGRLFVKSLPPCRIVHTLDAVDDFLNT